MGTASSIRQLPPPRRLLWKSNQHVQGLVTAAQDRLQRQDGRKAQGRTCQHFLQTSGLILYLLSYRLVNNLDMDVFKFKAYGKEFIKMQKMSPDAFVQVALQLAFYK